MQTLRRSGPSRYLRPTASSSSSSSSKTSTQYTLSRDAPQSDSSLSLGDSCGETSKDTTKTRSRHARPSPRTVNERPRAFRSGLSSADVGMVSPDIAYLISVTKVIKGKVQYVSSHPTHIGSALIALPDRVGRRYSQSRMDRGHRAKNPRRTNGPKRRASGLWVPMSPNRAPTYGWTLRNLCRHTTPFQDFNARFPTEVFSFP